MPLPNALLPPRRKQQGSLSVFRDNLVTISSIVPKVATVQIDTPSAIVANAISHPTMCRSGINTLTVTIPDTSGTTDLTGAPYYLGADKIITVGVNSAHHHTGFV